MEKIKPRILSGFMELLPAQQKIFDDMMNKLKTVYSLYGFTSLDTPLIESSEILLAKGGGDTEKQIYRFTKGDSDLSLRFDLTVPLARYVAEHCNDLTFPFRRFQIGKVYRGERAQKGRFREFYQADIDIIGDEKLDIMNEAEIPSIIYKAFTSLGLKKFVIHINNRKILNGFFLMIDEKEKSSDIMRIIDKLDKIGRDNVAQMLVDNGIPTEKVNTIIDFISTDKSNIVSVLTKYKGINDELDLGISELFAVIENMKGFGVPEENFTVDLTIARGLDYYTGTVYETIVTDHPEIGSVCSGGRYDDLASYYTDKKLPGVGISIGLTRLFYVLGEQNYLNPDYNSAPADIVIIPMTDDVSYSVEYATLLRNNGIRTILYTEKKKFKAKIGYSDKLNIPYSAFVGEDEINSNSVSLKNMKTGEQVTMSKEESVELIKKSIEAFKDMILIRE